MLRKTPKIDPLNYENENFDLKYIFKSAPVTPASPFKNESSPLSVFYILSN